MLADTATTLITLGLIVATISVHELGHVAAAKLCRVRVDMCSIGFGRPLLQWRWGNTYWRLAAIPLGGFTKLAGERSHESIGDPQEYFNKPLLARVFIGAMGSGANFLFAFILVASSCYLLRQPPVYLNGASIDLAAVPASIGDGTQVPLTKSTALTVFEILRVTSAVNATTAVSCLRIVSGLVTRETTMTSLPGPIRMIQILNDAAHVDVARYATTLALISVVIGVLNLLPVPVLDGGHIALMLLEAVVKREFSVRVRDKILMCGFVLLLIPMVAVIYSDLVSLRFVKRLVSLRWGH
jgi:membrane-associated protease RseP (regulator of RpoE activity)